MIVVALRPEHLAALSLQASQRALSPLVLCPDYAETLITAGPAFAGFSAGRVVACAGIVRLTEQRGHAWALLDGAAGADLIAIHRAVVRFLADQPVRRVETAVDGDFTAGHRWVRMLGFQREGRMRCYGPDNRDADLYARIRM